MSPAPDIADSAETTITVNNGAGNPPPRPDFRAARRPIETTERVPNQSYTHNTVVTPGSVSSSTHHQINWGGVVKGAAIVTGVVLAGVVVYAVAVPAIGAALSWLGANTFLGGAINAVAPAVAWAGDMAMSGALFVGHAVESTLVALAGATGLSGAAAGAASTASGALAAGTAVAPATATAISGAGGAIAAGGAVAVGAPIAAKAIMTTPMIDTVHTTHASAPVLTGMEDGGHSLQQGVNHVPTQVAGTHHGPQQQASSTGMDLPDVPDEVLHEQAASIKTASKMAHHAIHESEGGAHDSHENRTQAALRNGARTSQVWADRVGQRQAAAITPRSSQFSNELAEERERLAQALGQPQVG